MPICKNCTTLYTEGTKCPNCNYVSKYHSVKYKGPKRIM